MSDAPAPTKQTHDETIKGTLISIIIALVLAFVFRGFIIEAFVIPTGSMAPTLMGAHMRFRGEESGNSWPVGPWYAASPTGSDYINPQGDTTIRVPGGTVSFPPITVHDPLTGEPLRDRSRVPLGAGDRILVLKYLYLVRPPSRYDVAVLKNPMDPNGDAGNYIKRIVGLPGEALALVDGDVFVRKPRNNNGDTSGDWDAPGWEIARKPPRVQRAVWQTIFDSSYAPVSTPPPSWFTTPWTAGDPETADDWSIGTNRVYRYEGAGPTSLRFDQSKQRYAGTTSPTEYHVSPPENWTIDDRYAYDEAPFNPVFFLDQYAPGEQRNIRMSVPFQEFSHARFPVSDIRARAGVRFEQSPAPFACVLEARGHVFRADFLPTDSGLDVVLKARTAAAPSPDSSLPDSESPDTGSPDEPWQTLNMATTTHRLEPGAVTNVRFVHADQQLRVLIDGSVIVEATYGDDWTPADRIFHATGRSLESILDQDASVNPLQDTNGTMSPRERSPAEPLYKRPEFRWEFAGGPVTLHRVALDRDIFYQPDTILSAAEPARGTHPDTTVFLGPDQFFVCGDNSPYSLDSRLMPTIDPWVARRMRNAETGIVPRQMLLGKAFFVYFPSVIRDGPLPFVPDFGRMRLIY